MSINTSIPTVTTENSYRARKQTGYRNAKNKRTNDDENPFKGEDCKNVKIGASIGSIVGGAIGVPIPPGGVWTLLTAPLGAFIGGIIGTVVTHLDTKKAEKEANAHPK